MYTYLLNGHISYIIQPLNEDTLVSTKNMIAQSFADVEEMSLEESLTLWHESGCFDDLKDFQTTYFRNNGYFLIALDQKDVIGCAAIKKIDNESCELKKLYILKKYHKQRIASKMWEYLLMFAQEQGYKKIYLNVYHPLKQSAALCFYKKLGFQPCTPYTAEEAELYMYKNI